MRQVLYTSQNAHYVASALLALLQLLRELLPLLPVLDLHELLHALIQRVVNDLESLKGGAATLLSLRFLQLLDQVERASVDVLELSETL